jgi:glycerophosphoryl diester phosphodiesterase
MRRDHRFPDDAFPLIVAHRGASATHPENTLASFEEALRLGAPVIELDVRLSLDGVPVVMHDPTVDRTTDGAGAVGELTAADVSSLNAGTADAPSPVPTLRQVLELASGRAGLAIEIKNLPGEPGFDPVSEPIVEAVHAELDRVGFVGPVLVVSFNPASIEASKAIEPDVPTGFLTTDHVDPREALAYAASKGHDMVLPGTRASIPAGEAFVEEVHADGMLVGTWTVDDAPTMRMLLDRAFDAVASNDPAMALGVLAEWSRSRA